MLLQISRRAFGGATLALLSATAVQAAPVGAMTVDEALASLDGPALGRLIADGIAEIHGGNWGFWATRASSMAYVAMPVAREAILAEGGAVALDGLKDFLRTGAVFDAVLDARIADRFRVNLLNYCSTLPGYVRGAASRRIHPVTESQHGLQAMMVIEVLDLLRADDPALPSAIAAGRVDWTSLQQQGV